MTSFSEEFNDLIKGMTGIDKQSRNELYVFLTDKGLHYHTYQGRVGFDRISPEHIKILWAFTKDVEIIKRAGQYICWGHPFTGDLSEMVLWIQRCKQMVYIDN